MKLDKWLTAPAAIMLAGALGGSSPVSAAERAGPRVQAAFTATGPIRPADNPHWCLTAPARPAEGAHLYMARCVKNDAWQTWFAWRVIPGNAGGINIAISPDDQVCQKGKISGPTADWHVKICTKASEQPFIVDYTPYEKGWLLHHLFFPRFFAEQTRFITAPTHITKVVPAYWRVAASSDRKSQEWLFGAWKKLDTAQTSRLIEREVIR